MVGRNRAAPQRPHQSACQTSVPWRRSCAGGGELGRFGHGRGSECSRPNGELPASYPCPCHATKMKCPERIVVQEQREYAGWCRFYESRPRRTGLACPRRIHQRALVSACGHGNPARAPLSRSRRTCASAPYVRVPPYASRAAGQTSHGLGQAIGSSAALGKRMRGGLRPAIRAISTRISCRVMSPRRDTDGGNAARIDDAADAGDARRSQDIARPFLSFDLRKDLRLIGALTRTPDERLKRHCDDHIGSESITRPAIR
jgi:hypothetical protein